MNTEQILDTLRDVFLSQPIEAQERPVDDIFVRLPAKHIRLAAQILVEWFDVWHLSTLTGQDTEEGIELLYHFWDGTGIGIGNDFWGGKVLYYKFSGCEHTYRELTQKECREKDIMHHGMCWHVY